MTDKRPFIIFGIGALLILAIFLVFRSNNHFNWNENYEEDNKMPYGSFVVYNLLQEYFPNRPFHEVTKSIYTELSDTSDHSGNYVFIGEGMYLDSIDVEQLLSFVSGGNNAFIASKSIPYDLMFHLYYEECNDYFWDDYVHRQDTSVKLNILHSNLKDQYGFEYKYLYKGKAKNYQWQYIDSIYFCKEDYSFIELGTINDGYINFAKKKYGKGAFYLHTNPIAFTNIQLLDNQGLAYANKVFSHLSEGPLYWDKFSRVPESISRRRNQMAYNDERRLPTEGPLSFILKQESLAWAWYLALVFGLLYLVFRAKRKQRIIPVLEGNTNTSLEFISTIGRLYFLQNDHKKLCLQKMRLFLSYIRERYHMQSKQIDETFVKNLSMRSEVPENVISKIALYYKNIKSGTFVSEKTLVDFHLEMDKFYKNRK